MYSPTRFSGNLPKFLEMECKDPFSQYLIRALAERQEYSLEVVHVLEDDVEGLC